MRFSAITDFESLPRWRSGVKQVEILKGQTSAIVFREHGNNGVITYKVESMEPASKVVTRIADEKLPFGGSWTYELRPNSRGTELTITENGEVYNPFFRFFSRFVFSHYATIDSYLKDLNKKFGQVTVGLEG